MCREAHTLRMTTYTTHEQATQQDALAALRAEMYAAQVARANAHNITKHAKTFIGQGTRGIPSYATTTNHNER